MGLEGLAQPLARLDPARPLPPLLSRCLEAPLSRHERLEPRGGAPFQGPKLTTVPNSETGSSGP